MNTYFPNPRQTVDSVHGSVFNHLRERLSQEVSCRELADLLESVNAMQRAQAAPEEFNLRFEEFVYRAEEYMATVRPFFPALVAFLPSHRVSDAVEPRSFDAPTRGGIVVRVA
jgi:hypothetical protein